MLKNHFILKEKQPIQVKSFQWRKWEAALTLYWTFINWALETAQAVCCFSTPQKISAESLRCLIQQVYSAGLT